MQGRSVPMAEHVAVCCEGSVAGDRQDRVCGLLHYVKTNTARRCVGMKFLSLLFTALNLLPSRPIRLDRKSVVFSDLQAGSSMRSTALREDEHCATMCGHEIPVPVVHGFELAAIEAD